MNPERSYTLTHEIGATTHLTRAELGVLDFCARAHYDGRCVAAALNRGEKSPKSTFEATVNGFIAILHLRMALDLPESPKPDSVEARWSFDEFDTSMKILEVSPHFPAQAPREVVDPLCRKLRICMAAINAEARRLHEARAPIEIREAGVV